MLARRALRRCRSYPSHYLGSRDELRRKLEPLRDEKDVVFDFTEVRFLDASCLSAFVRLHKERRAAGFRRETIILPKTSPIRRLFAAAGVMNLFKIVESPESAQTTQAAQILEYAFSGTIADLALWIQTESYEGPERRKAARSAG